MKSSPLWSRYVSLTVICSFLVCVFFLPVRTDSNLILYNIIFTSVLEISTKGCILVYISVTVISYAKHKIMYKRCWWKQLSVNWLHSRTHTHTEEMANLLMELEHIFTTVVLVNCFNCPDEKICFFFPFISNLLWNYLKRSTVVYFVCCCVTIS